jgi:hypothetical protein
MGTAPLSTTTLVFSDVPDAMLVSAQAASNCSQEKVKVLYIKLAINKQIK